jgi:hypothetical protein
LKINVNVHDLIQPVFIIMLKIQYHNAQWKRIVETMATMVPPLLHRAGSIGINF